MTNQHPITPPLALIDQWWEEAKQNAKYDEPIGPLVATKAAQWGADQQFEATDTWIRTEIKDRLRPANRIADDHRADMRPKPPSLKEQALAALEDDDIDIYLIRRALEAL